MYYAIIENQWTRFILVIPASSIPARSEPYIAIEKTANNAGVKMCGLFGRYEYALNYL